MKKVLLFFIVLGLSVITAFADQDLWTQYSSLAPAGKSFPAGGDKSALVKGELQPGAWAVYRVSEGKVLQMVLRMAVAAKDGDAWVYEFTSSDGTQTTSVQEAVKGLESVIKTGDASQGEVVWVKIKRKDGKVMTLDGSMLSMGGGLYTKMLTANSAKFSGTITKGGPVTVAAGTFADTWLADSQVSAGKSSEAGQAWVSSVVPLWHLIKAVNKDGTRTVELVDFGTSGFQSSFQ